MSVSASMSLIKLLNSGLQSSVGKISGNAIPLGAHLHCSRALNSYHHHGIYIGDGKVIHYSGFADGMCSGPIEEISLQDFLQGNKYVFIRDYSKEKFTGEEIVRRAKTRLGEDKYNIFTNNCEHFATWATQDVEASSEISTLVGKFLDFAIMIKRSPVGVFIVIVKGVLDSFKNVILDIENCDKRFVHEKEKELA